MSSVSNTNKESHTCATHHEANLAVLPFTVTPLFTLKVNNRLAEGILWDEQQQRILWTDIEAAQLYIFTLHDAHHVDSIITAVKSCADGDEIASEELGHLTALALPERLGSFGLTEQPEQLICAFESGFALFNIATQTVQWLHKIAPDVPYTRMNDGRVDPQGNFWAGSMVELDKFKQLQNNAVGETTSEQPHGTNEAQQARKARVKMHTGSLYCLTPKGDVSKQITDLHISNSLCWSNDGTIMYHADTPTCRIKCYQLQAHSGVQQWQPLDTFVTTPEGYYPDGAITDALGNIWSAQWGSSSVACYSSNGELLQRISVPAEQVSCVALGGPNGDWLMVTTASQLSDAQKAQQPQAGHVFVYQICHTATPDTMLAKYESRFTYVGC